jgi:alpha-tubulin suppressor-like RCC1 family protein
MTLRGQHARNFGRAALCVIAAMIVFACNATEQRDDGLRLPLSQRRMNVGETTNCALSKDSTLYCWGRNSDFMEFGIHPSTRPNSTRPYSTTVTEYVAVMGGHGSHSCAITAERAARCWGRNTNGQLGSGSFPTTGSPPELVGLNDWSNITVSRLTTCGVLASRRAYCWGANQRGELGNSTRAVALTYMQPVPVESDEQFQSVAPGWLHTCALTVAGVAMCWGDNNHGQLGLGVVDTSAHRVPVRVATELRFTELSSGANYTCGITVSSDAYCWGQNATGQLGDGTTTTRDSPTLVSGGFKFAHINTGSGFAAGTSATPPTPVQGAVAHTCALLANSSAYCWGWNGAGQLGDGTFVSKTTPVAVSGGLRFDELGAGGSHTCGRNGSLIFCWGGNIFGQLGNGSVTSSNVPLAVSDPFLIDN